MVSDCFLSCCRESLGWVGENGRHIDKFAEKPARIFCEALMGGSTYTKGKRTSETERDVDYEGRHKTNSFCSVNSSIAYFTPSRPSPESFTPP